MGAVREKFGVIAIIRAHEAKRVDEIV